ncbi:hypothetical protein [Rhizobium leguminosarum]|uniref:hypothetical protein n=1 Tax=Rhizobium leguminosarum TaxID=384 RepID=UPI001FD8C124|nr:hypothetical protein [Rhizobium leguminosarum]
MNVEDLRTLSKLPMPRAFLQQHVDWACGHRSALLVSPKKLATPFLKEINRMLQRPSVEHHRTAVTVFSIALLGIALSGCVSAEERRYADANTCQSFGAPYGSPAYTNCMLEQQRRRDNEELESLEQTRLTTEIARDAEIMADRARRERCHRDPDRRECRR